MYGCADLGKGQAWLFDFSITDPDIWMTILALQLDDRERLARIEAIPGI